ncbi:MAG: phenylalanine--tRNA ligase subunit beta, partial [Bdellovibrionales bacterium]|nr:phenylalanine--tRNA ligase subunit beta [Bdellovibrionales bacterium]
MRISRTWLSDWVDFDDLSAEQFEELITTRVAEVDAVHVGGVGLQHAVAAHVVAADSHPTKSALTIATIAVGDAQVQVVCGAPNCRVGMVTAYVPPGGVVVKPGGEGAQEIVVREVAGVVSHGILVSEAELGIGPSHEGILELESASPGDRLSQHLGVVDTLLEIDNKSLTHRPDLWSHFGFAREIGAILGRPLKKNADAWSDAYPEGADAFRALGGAASNFSVKVAPESGCRRFTALELRQVEAKPSPDWMRRRLYSVGAGVRNLLVDLSNYVMHDIGQPNHAYDADLLEGHTIFVRGALPGEVFSGLDGEERSLVPEDIVIADGSGCVALGGVMGGAPTAVRAATTRLLLEAANFDPVRIRHTTKRHNLRTDASNRFEKSLSAYTVPLATQRFVELLRSVQPKVEIVGAPADDFPQRPAAVQVPLRCSYIRERLGTELSNERIEGILSALGFRDTGSGSVDVPYYRATRDISIEDDLVEEVGRINGYENVPEASPRIESRAARPRPLHELEYRLQDALVGMGFSEFYHYSFMNGGRAASLGYSTDAAVEVVNPVDQSERLIRTTLVPGMIEVLDKNARYRESMQLFELGRAYRTSPYAVLAELTGRPIVERPAAFEHRLLSLGYASGR